MQSDLTQIEDPEDRVQELEDELRNAKAQMEKLGAAKREAENEASSARAELAGLQRADEDETARLTADHRRTVAVVEDLQLQIKKLREQLHNEQAEHKAETERLRTEATLQQPAQPLAVDSDANASELEAKQTELNTAILERDAVRDDLEAQQSKLNAAILERDDAQDGNDGPAWSGEIFDRLLSCNFDCTKNCEEGARFREAHREGVQD